MAFPPANQGPNTRRPRPFSSHHMGQPTTTEFARHTCRPDRGQSRFSLPPRGKYLLGHSLAYHKEHLPFESDNRAGLLQIIELSCARSPHCEHHKPTAARISETDTARATENAAAAPPTTLGYLTSGGTTGITVTKLENAPHSAPASTKTPASKGTSANRGTPGRRKISNSGR
jgi:hypothetical protein